MIRQLPPLRHYERHTKMNESQARYWVILCCLFSLACLSWGSSGIRGTDQYWYLSDVETLTQNSATTTNTYYPGVILRKLAESGMEPNHFIHNGPMLHLTSKLSDSNNVYSTWVTVNMFCHLWIALSIFIIAKKYGNLESATWACCLYLLSPIALWQGMNMLQEQSHAALMAMYFLCYIFRNSLLALALSFAVHAVGTTAHPIFFALSMLFSVTLLVRGLQTRKILLVTFGLTLGCVCTYIKLKTDEWFPSSFQPSLSAIISGSIPGKTNLLWQLAEIQPGITFDLIKSKILAAIEGHFLKPATAPFFMYTNISLLALAYLAYNYTRKYAELILPIAITLGLYAAILVLMQTQSRYQQIVSPVTFVAIALAIYELRNRIPRVLLPILLVCTACLGGYMAQKVRQEGLEHAAGNSIIKSQLEEFSKNSNFVSYGNGNAFDLRFSYLAKPRKVLVINPEFLNMPDQLKAIGAFNPDYFITQKKLDSDFLPVNESPEGVIETNLKSFHIYRYQP